MGYTTKFWGSLSVSNLTEEQRTYINNFAETRRMHRDCNRLMEMYNGKYGHPTPESNTPEGIYGKDGEFFAGIDDSCYIDYNDSKSQPGLWCQWVINENNELGWDGVEKFYNYVEWLEFLIDNFFSKWGCVLNGKIKYRGRDYSDRGYIEVIDNNINRYEQ